MGLFGSKKEGGLMDVIRCDEQNYLVWKWTPNGQGANSSKKENAIRYGSSLRVKDGEMAVFVYKQKYGTMEDFITGPYDGTIKTANFPVLSSIVGLAFGGSSPFQAEIYFFNLAGNVQINFGVPYFDVADPRFLDFTVPVAVRGMITFNITDVKQFIKLNRLQDFSLDVFNNQIKGMVQKFVRSFVTNCPAQNDISVLQLGNKIAEINDMLQEKLASQVQDNFGVNLKRIDVSAIDIDKESEDYKEFIHVTKEQVGRRAEIDTDIYGEKGHLAAESQFIQAHAINQQTKVMQVVAENLGNMSQMGFGGGGMNPAGIMMGMAMGGAMGGQMANMMNNMGQAQQQAMQQPNQNAPQTPPPPPPQVTYTLNINGQNMGPYTLQQLQQMIQSGQINKDTYVWKQGMQNWELAGNVQELSALFGAVPPPPPPMPPTK